jgi:acyl-CoA thioesterase FadM
MKLQPRVFAISVRVYYEKTDASSAVYYASYLKPARADDDEVLSMPGVMDLRRQSRRAGPAKSRCAAVAR